MSKRTRYGGRKIFKIRDMVIKYNGYKEEKKDAERRNPRRAIMVARALRVGPVGTLNQLYGYLHLPSIEVIQPLQFYKYIQTNQLPTPRAIKDGIAIEFWEIYDKKGNLLYVCKEEPSEMENSIVKLKYLWNVKNVAKVVDAYKKQMRLDEIDAADDDVN